MEYALDERSCRNFDLSSRREWLLPNGIGGYAMGTVSGANTRRYHGHLVAAVKPPVDRMVLLASIEAAVLVGAQRHELGTNQYPGALHPEGYLSLRSFSASASQVKWTWPWITKSIELTPGVNRSVVRFECTAPEGITLVLRPLVCHKPYHENFRKTIYPDQVEANQNSTRILRGGILLTLEHPGAKSKQINEWYYNLEHLREFERGLDPRDDLFAPVELTYQLARGEVAELIAEYPGERLAVSLPQMRASDLTSALQEAASRFIVQSPERKTILAGYPWFTDWGRDTMISLPGICLCTGETAAARAILGDTISSIHEGLIPNRVPETGEPEFNTADATLWMAHALHKTLECEWDTELAERGLGALDEIVRCHIRGTMNGIIVDSNDGLLVQGAEGQQLTWMDAKVHGEVITPRQGKAVEINGLWINLLRVGEWLSAKLGRPTALFEELALEAEASFDHAFWDENLGYYLDVAEPRDPSLRPNQVIALALPFCSFDVDHARRALAVVRRELLTARGLRTLGPSDERYRGRFEGSLPSLDRAYHQGTAWPWLLGPYVAALRRYDPDALDMRALKQSFREMLIEYGLGGIAEVYDGDVPQRPNGCPWQAWSVAAALEIVMER